jgi:hypothetical protein
MHTLKTTTNYSPSAARWGVHLHQYNMHCRQRGVSNVENCAFLSFIPCVIHKCPYDMRMSWVSTRTHGIQGYPWTPGPRGSIDSMGSSEIKRSPWTPRVPMDSIGAHGFHRCPCLLMVVMDFHDRGAKRFHGLRWIPRIPTIPKVMLGEVPDSPSEIQRRGNTNTY